MMSGGGFVVEARAGAGLPHSEGVPYAANGVKGEAEPDVWDLFEGPSGVVFAEENFDAALRGHDVDGQATMP